MRLLYEAVSTWFHCGRVPWAPGTVGSVAAVVFFPLVVLSGLFGVLLSGAMFLLGLWAVSHYLASSPNAKDPQEVVVDEVAGQLLAFSIPISLAEVGVLHLVPMESTFGCTVLSLVSFVLFRFFDVVKPWPICTIDTEMEGAVGIMLDDTVAAVFAAVVFLAAVSLFEMLV